MDDKAKKPDEKANAGGKVKEDKAQDKHKGEKAAEKAIPPKLKSAQISPAKPTTSPGTGDGDGPVNKSGEMQKLKDEEVDNFDPQATAAILAHPDADSLRYKKLKETEDKAKKAGKEKREPMKVEIIESDDTDLPLKEAFGDTPSEKKPDTKTK
uniref:Calpain inhibitor n=1 Tax=Trichuris muris TaxID=70415 RepID=A0A5S6QDQ6_TRIMR